jgi:hypothetical protein
MGGMKRRRVGAMIVPTLRVGMLLGTLRVQ